MWRRQRRAGEGRAKVFEGVECTSSFCHGKAQAWEEGAGIKEKVTRIPWIYCKFCKLLFVIT